MGVNSSRLLPLAFKVKWRGALTSRAVVQVCLAKPRNSCLSLSAKWQKLEMEKIDIHGH